MKIYKVVLMALVGVGFGNQERLPDAGLTEVRGKVYDSASRKPLSNIHSYIKDGEEEDLTDSSGVFQIRTYQQAPITVNFSHPDYQPVKVVWKKAEQPITVVLQKKK